MMHYGAFLRPQKTPAQWGKTLQFLTIPRFLRPKEMKKKLKKAP